MAGTATSILGGILNSEKARESGGTGSSQSRRSVAVRIVPGPNDVLVLIRAGAAMAA